MIGRPRRPGLAAARLAAFLAATAAAAAAATAPAAPPPLAQADLPLSALRDAPPRIYHLRVFDVQRGPDDAAPSGGAFTVDSRELGALAVSTQVTDDRQAPLELIDRLDADLGTKTVVRVTHARADALLSPARVRLEAHRGEHSAVTRAAFNGRRVSVDPPGDREPERRHDYPANTLTMSTLLRIAPLLPRDTGELYRIDGFVELFEFQPVTPADGGAFILAGLGPDPVRIARREYACLRYRLDLGDTGDSVELWVDREGALRQFVVGGKMRGTLGKPGPIDRDPVLTALIERLEADAEREGE